MRGIVFYSSHILGGLTYTEHICVEEKVHVSWTYCEAYGPRCEEHAPDCHVIGPCDGSCAESVELDPRIVETVEKFSLPSTDETTKEATAIDVMAYKLACKMTPHGNTIGEVLLSKSIKL